MFNRAFEVKMVKTNTSKNAVDPTAASAQIDYDRIITIVQDNAKKAAIGFVAVYAAVTVLKTSSQIAVNAAPKR